MKIECPHCSQHLDAAPVSTDSAATCPTCGGEFVIPASSASVAPSPSFSLNSPGTATSKPVKQLNGRCRFLASVLLLKGPLICAAMIFIAWNFHEHFDKALLMFVGAMTLVATFVVFAAAKDLLIPKNVILWALVAGGIGGIGLVIDGKIFAPALAPWPDTWLATVIIAEMAVDVLVVSASVAVLINKSIVHARQ